MSKPSKALVLAKKDSTAIEPAGVAAQGRGDSRDRVGPPRPDFIKKLEAERKAREQGRLVYRLRRQLVPWYIALALLGLAGAEWLTRLLASGATVAVMTAVCSAIPPFVGWAVGRVVGPWAGRLRLAGVAAGGWLIAASAFGPSWGMVLVLVLLTVAFALGYWRHYRIPNPLGRETVEVVTDEPVHERWARYVAGGGGVLPESYLTDADTSQPNKRTYTVQLAPGRQTLSTALTGLERVASGLDVPVRNLVLEPHPDESPNRIKLTIVKQSPIAQTVEYTGPKITLGRPGDSETGEESQPFLIHVGPYGDGEGYAPFRLWTPGEKGVKNSGSAQGGFILGGTGSGKSRTAEAIATGAMSSGYVEFWFIDPQGGASSPALAKFADWYGDLDDAPKMLTALENLAAARGMEMAVEGWTRFDPRPERPLLLVFIDEAHEVFALHTDRWAKLARKVQKVGIAFIALSQYAGLTTFGNSEPLRSSICSGNVIAMRSESKSNGQLVPGLELDPLSLPALPGFGYTVARGTYGRTAPYRAEYIADPAAWLSRYPGPGLDALSANACGDVYLKRREAAETKRDENQAKVDALKSGGQLGGARVTVSPPAAPSSVGDGPQVPDFPAAPTLQLVAAAPLVAEAAGATQRDRILAALAAGERATGELQEIVDGSESGVRKACTELVEAGLVRRVRRGVWALAEVEQETAKA